MDYWEYLRHTTALGKELIAIRAEQGEKSEASLKKKQEIIEFQRKARKSGIDITALWHYKEALED